MRNAGFLLLIALIAGCGDEFEEGPGASTGAPPPPCNRDPWTCPEKQTCWPTSATTFDCLNEGPGGEGEPCEALTSPTCRAGLFCYQLSETAPGTCMPFCDPADPQHSCPNDGPCDQLYIDPQMQVTIRVCRPPGA